MEGVELSLTLPEDMKFPERGIFSIEETACGKSPGVSQTIIGIEKEREFPGVIKKNHVGFPSMSFGFWFLNFQVC